MSKGGNYYLFEIAFGLNVVGWVALLVGCCTQYWPGIEDNFLEPPVINLCDVTHVHHHSVSEFVVCDVNAVCKVCNFTDFAEDLCDSLHFANIRHTEITICSSDALCKVCVFNYTHDDVCTDWKFQHSDKYQDVIICSPDSKCKLCNFTSVKDDPDIFYEPAFDDVWTDWSTYRITSNVCVALLAVFMEFFLILWHGIALCSASCKSQCSAGWLAVFDFYCGVLIVIYAAFYYPWGSSRFILMTSALSTFVATGLTAYSFKYPPKPDYNEVHRSNDVIEDIVGARNEQEVDEDEGEDRRDERAEAEEVNQSDVREVLSLSPEQMTHFYARLPQIIHALQMQYHSEAQ